MLTEWTSFMKTLYITDSYIHERILQTVYRCRGRTPTVYDIKTANKGCLYFTISQTGQPIHKVEIVGLIRKIFENSEKTFKVLTVDDGTGCIQCMCSGSTLNGPHEDFSEDGFGEALNMLALSFQQPTPAVGHMIRVRGILTLTKNFDDQMTKQLKVLEYGIETDPNTFADWIFGVSDVWDEIFCRRNKSESMPTLTDNKKPRQQSADPTKKELINLWAVIEQSIHTSTINQSSVAKLCNEGTLSTTHHNLCSKLQSVPELWERFISSLIEHGCVLRDNSGEDIVVTRHSKLVKSVVNAAKEERSLKAIVNRVCNSFRGQCTEKTVLYVLAYLEHESLVYSFVNERGQKMYNIV